MSHPRMTLLAAAALALLSGVAVIGLMLLASPWEVAAAAECKVTIAVNQRQCRRDTPPLSKSLGAPSSYTEWQEWQKKADERYAACEEDIKRVPYEVAKLVNTLTPPLGTPLSGSQIQALIDQGTCVEVRPPGTFW